MKSFTQTTRFIVLIGLIAVFACGGSMCATTSSNTPLTPAAVATDVQQAVNWAVPVASAIIGVVGNQQEKDAMSLAAASVSTLNAVVAKVQASSSPAQATAANSALQQSWDALNGVITAQAGANSKVGTIIQAATNGLAAATGNPVITSPVPTPTPAGS